MRKHIETHTGRSILPCGICEFETTKKATLNEHIDAKHKTEKSDDTDSRMFLCDKCEKKYYGDVAFKNHKCSSLIQCDFNQCKFAGKDVPDIVSHINKEHRKTVHACVHCEYESQDKSKLMVHIKTNHQKISMLNSLFSQQTLLCETLQLFKNDVGNILNTLLLGQNTLRDELALLMEKPQSDNSEVNEVPRKEKEVTVENETYAEKAAKKLDGKYKNKEPERKKSGNSDRVNKPSQVLVVGDSHVHGLDKRAFERLTKTNADIAIAYTTDSDEDARYPERNFLQTVPDRLKNKDYDTLILQGGCNEISNVKVNQNFTPKDVKVWEEKVYQSRAKMFKLAEDCLEQNKDLKKVVIVSSLPRYDSIEKDPHSIKEKLNKFGNSVFSSLWMQRGCPMNITVQDQKLDCHGELRGKRFGNPGQINQDGKPWDGIHLRGRLGPRHYTNSMAKIFAASFPGLLIDWSVNQSEDSIFHNTCPQTAYQRRNKGYNQEHMFRHKAAKQTRGFKRNNFVNSNGQRHFEENRFSIPVSNRFSKNF